MKEILNEMLSALKNGESVALCSILASSGSSPRGAGAKMAVFADGRTMGTIGGGQVEYLAAHMALDLLSTGETSLCSFDLQPDQVRSIGMICGGKVTVYFQIFTPDMGVDIVTLQNWRNTLAENKNAWLFLALDGEAVREFAVITEQEIPSEKETYFTTRAVWKDDLYVEPIVRAGRVYLFGGGHVGKALIPVLSAIDFSVVLLDNREELAKKENYPSAEQVIFADFARIDDYITLTKDDYAVVMTPGHQSDYEILSQILHSAAGYIGCIGSKNKVAATREKLLAAGYTESEIDRIYSPIGLPILAETPEEIAISIAAEMIEHRAKRRN